MMSTIRSIQPMSNTTRIAVTLPRSEMGLLIFHIHLAIRIDMSIRPAAHEGTAISSEKSACRARGRGGCTASQETNKASVDNRNMNQNTNFQNPYGSIDSGVLFFASSNPAKRKPPISVALPAETLVNVAAACGESVRGPVPAFQCISGSVVL
jgi:hypothetical protein